MPVLTQQLQVDFKGSSVSLSFDLVKESSEVIPGSLLSLLRLFGEEVMVIYDALFTGKRVGCTQIIVIGEEASAWDICKATCSCLMLLSPPLEGIVESYWYPYCPLTNLNFLNKCRSYRSLFIAGVSNPVFKQRENWWDVCVDLTARRVTSKHAYSQQPQYTSDLNFIRGLLQSVGDSEDSARNRFYDYTQYISDIALAKGYFQSGSRRTQKMYAEHGARVEKWEQTQAYAVSLGAVAGTYEDSPSITMRQLLTRLRVGMLDGSLDDAEAEKLYFELDTLLCTDRDCIELIAVMPNKGDLRCITWGLFRSKKGPRECALSMLMKLEEMQIGKMLISKLSQKEIERFQELKPR